MTDKKPDSLRIAANASKPSLENKKVTDVGERKVLGLPINAHNDLEDLIETDEVFTMPTTIVTDVDKDVPGKITKEDSVTTTRDEVTTPGTTSEHNLQVGEDPPLTEKENSDGKDIENNDRVSSKLSPDLSKHNRSEARNGGPRKVLSESSMQTFSKVSHLILLQQKKRCQIKLEIFIPDRFILVKM